MWTENGRPRRRHAVLVRLSDAERNGLAFLRDRESLLAHRSFAGCWFGKFGQVTKRANQ